MKPLWPHQNDDVSTYCRLLEEGRRRLCLTRPTGMGKSRTVAEIVHWHVARGERVVVYTNRRMLVQQLKEVMEGFGFRLGIRAAGHAPEPEHLLQIASIQTDVSRVLKVPKQLKELNKRFAEGDIEPLEFFEKVNRLEARKQDICSARVAIFDEAHNMASGAAVDLLARHVADEAAVLGVTATPLDIGHLYDDLIGNGNVSEGRACGALLPCQHYGPDEPDMEKLKVPLGQDLTEKQATNAIMRNGIIGRVVDGFRKYNPEGKPTILFGPSVAGSLYFAEEFRKAGIPAAHIDGDDIWLDGESYKASPEARKDVLAASRDGSIKVLCNRFVLREGIDCPWLAHGIMATVFGSLQSYIQAGGRLLRSFEGLEYVTLQDHGGNYWRHGSLNSDRHWSLDLTNAKAVGIRLEKIRRGEEPEPFRCPACGRIWIKGTTCSCGKTLDPSRKSRVVVEHDGTLKEMGGSVLPPRKEVPARLEDKLLKVWLKMYWAAKKGKSGMTFRQAIGWFVQKEHLWPPREWPKMPLDTVDEWKRVRDVPDSRLR